MKKSEIKSQAIVMCGISGSGKTYLARQFEDEGYVRLSTDNLIWEKISSESCILSKEEQKKLFSQCNEEVRNKLREHLKSGKKVVVDATHCKRSVRDEIRSICKDEGIRPLFIYCLSNKEELWNRLSKRRGEGPDDLIVTYEELTSYWNSFEQPQEDESDFLVYKDAILLKEKK